MPPLHSCILFTHELTFINAFLYLFYTHSAWSQRLHVCHRYKRLRSASPKLTAKGKNGSDIKEYSRYSSLQYKEIIYTAYIHNFNM